MIFKNFRTVLIGALLPVMAFAQADTVTISGTVNPSHNGEVVTVSHSIGTIVLKDSTLVTNGAFALTIQTTAPQLAFIRLGKVQPANNSPLYISKGSIVLKATDSLKYASITGNKLAQDYVRFQSQIEPILVERLTLIAKYTA